MKVAEAPEVLVTDGVRVCVTVGVLVTEGVKDGEDGGVPVAVGESVDVAVLVKVADIKAVKVVVGEAV